ncbi:hypothetical protein DFH08DRAFT_508053 [Mycena albidolilacea]|uniref:Uncharacterized protein n=1 Tax=Mycena albidolilacea TaxID=1033008 RepID=A0AAD7ADL9_9AGAR|nr:hypothetical protein DFH08DRAFT_508053 [Mycena albidolilacea]
MDTKHKVFAAPRTQQVAQVAPRWTPAPYPATPRAPTPDYSELDALPALVPVGPASAFIFPAGADTAELERAITKHDQQEADRRAREAANNTEQYRRARRRIEIREEQEAAFWAEDAKKRADFKAQRIQSGQQFLHLAAAEMLRVNQELSDMGDSASRKRQDLLRELLNSCPLDKIHPRPPTTPSVKRKSSEQASSSDSPRAAKRSSEQASSSNPPRAAKRSSEQASSSDSPRGAAKRSSEQTSSSDSPRASKRACHVAMIQSEADYEAILGSGKFADEFKAKSNVPLIQGLGCADCYNTDRPCVAWDRKNSISTGSPKARCVLCITRKKKCTVDDAPAHQAITTSFIKYHNSKIVGLVGQDREDTDPSSKRTGSPEA